MLNWHPKHKGIKPTGRQVRFPQQAICSTILVIGLFAGCEEPPERVLGRPGTSNTLAKSSPEEKFQQIVQYMRTTLEGEAPAYAGETYSGGFSSLSSARQVTSELLPPTTDTALGTEASEYQGKIVVTTRTRMMFQSATDKDKEESGEADRNSRSSSGSAKSGGASTDGVGNSSDALRNIPKKTLHQHEKESEDIYKLAYEDNRWVLKTDVSGEDEKQIKNAFDYILVRQ